MPGEVGLSLGEGPQRRAMPSPGDTGKFRSIHLAGLPNKTVLVQTANFDPCQIPVRTYCNFFAPPAEIVQQLVLYFRPFKGLRKLRL